MRPGDVVACSVLPPPPLEAAPEALPLDIVYEDEHLIVINKVGCLLPAVCRCTDLQRGSGTSTCL